MVKRGKAYVGVAGEEFDVIERHKNKTTRFI